MKVLGAGIEGVASAAECELNVALRTNGCTPANIYEYVASVHNRLDDFERDGRDIGRYGRDVGEIWRDVGEIYRDPPSRPTLALSLARTGGCPRTCRWP